MRFFTSSVMKPVDEVEVARLVVDAAENRIPVAVNGLGTKQGVGRPVQAAVAIDTTGLSGITLYEPNELVMSAKAGTSLHAIEDRLAQNGQMLAFEPLIFGAGQDRPVAGGTIGGVFMTNFGGSRRLSAGAPRDHLLGIRAVNGRGEILASGGRVMKNVTGIDLCRGLAGSWGTLAVATEVTFKVLPRPEQTRTLVLLGLHDDIAIEVLCMAMGTPHEVSGACHLQSAMAARLREPRLKAQGEALTLLRLEGFGSFLPARIGKLRELFKPYGDAHELDDVTSTALWSELRELSYLQASRAPVWRISTAPTHGPRIVKALSTYMPCAVAYDWSGGLVWLEVPQTSDAGSSDIRRVIASHGGHATLIRAEPSVRAAADVFQPLSPGLQRVSRGLKAAFDPAGILNPGRLYADA